MEDKCNFTFRHYGNILKSAKRKGFKFAFFTERNSSQKVIYLRHDIDISLENAFRVAEIAKRNKARSTFFIRTHSNFYNPFFPENVRTIRKIFDLGHMIGLHYDGEVDLEKLEELIDQEYLFLKNFIPLSKIVSFHRPNPKVFDLELKEFINTYSHYFFNKGKYYISDSNRELKRGCIKEFIQKTQNSKIQILIHPIWWNEKSLNKKQVYYNILKNKEREVINELKNNTKWYKELFEKS